MGRNWNQGIKSLLIALRRASPAAFNSLRAMSRRERARQSGFPITSWKRFEEADGWAEITSSEKTINTARASKSARNKRNQDTKEKPAEVSPMLRGYFLRFENYCFHEIGRIPAEVTEIIENLIETEVPEYENDV